MIPYFQLPVVQLGPIPLDPWGTLVCIGFVLGLEIVRARGIREGLDVRDVVDGIVATVLMGFVGGHLVHVLAYHPEQLQEQGVMALVRIWAGFSSFGGFIGAIVGSLLFYGVVRRRSWWAHADVIMYGFPFAWIFGRLGCFIVHDHIGRPTTFPLAVHYPASMGGETRFDLGLNEALLAVVISVVFWVLGRKSRPGGFFLTVWCLLYAPVRFGFDFLRAAADDPHVAHPDVRWGALTPAQWGCILMFCAGLAGLARLRRLATAPVAEEGRTDSGSAAE